MGVPSTEREGLFIVPIVLTRHRNLDVTVTDPEYVNDTLSEYRRSSEEEFC